MATAQFLVRNRHQNIWYGPVVIPHSIRPLFQGQREIRQSLATADRKLAKKRALQFWVNCQQGIDALRFKSLVTESFAKTREFLAWLSYETR